jgi:hypothetical protein
MFVFGQKLYHQEPRARNADAIWIWSAAASAARRRFGLAAKIQSAAVGGALQMVIGLLPFLIDSPD